MDIEPQPTSVAGGTVRVEVPPAITITNSGTTSTVNMEQINSLLEDIGKYNSQFSTPSILAGLFEARVDPDSTDPSGLKSVGEEQQYMTASGIDAMNGPTLRALGLSIEPVSLETGQVMVLGETAKQGILRLNIQDRGQFSAFLKVLTAEQVRNTPIGENLTMLADSLSGQVLSTYDLKQPSDQALAFLASLDTIVSEYRRLGLDQQANLMEEYLTHSRQGNLREFIAIKKLPSEVYTIDIAAQHLRSSWDRILEVLHSAKQNPKAKVMVTEAIDRLRNSLPKARERLSWVHYSPEERAELAEILNDVAVKLLELEHKV